MERGFCVKNNNEKKSCGKKMKVIILTLAVTVGICAAVLGTGISGGEKNVKFDEVSEKKMPADITNEVIPEYREFERALACMIDDDVYVIVTRGEKPSSGFHVSVDKIKIEEKDDKSNLIVYALFEDPDKETPISQIVTYPLCVVKTDLNDLPDTIELRIQY